MFKEAVKASGSEFLFVLIPERSALEADTHFFKRSLIEEVRDRPSLDLLTFLTEAGPAEALYYHNDIHLNSEGHRVVARAISDYLIRNKVFERKRDK